MCFIISAQKVAAPPPLSLSLSRAKKTRLPLSPLLFFLQSRSPEWNRIASLSNEFITARHSYCAHALCLGFVCTRNPERKMPFTSVHARNCPCVSVCVCVCVCISVGGGTRAKVGAGKNHIRWLSAGILHLPARASIEGECIGIPSGVYGAFEAESIEGY